LITRNKIKQYSQLKQKKYQKENNLFIAEGIKTIKEFLQERFEYEAIIHSESVNEITGKFKIDLHKCFKVDFSTINKISSFKSPQPVLGVFNIPSKTLLYEEIEKKLTIFLDDVKDPGNLGTIIRIADWFGIENIVCSKETVDAYNPKTVQSSMGSLARVNVFYTDLPQLLKKTKSVIYGTHLKGKNIYTMELNPNGCIVFGNESKGISKEIDSLISERILIPGFPNNKKSIDSLNISVSAGIVCAEFRRRSYSK